MAIKTLFEVCIIPIQFPKTSKVFSIKFNYPIYRRTILSLVEKGLVTGSFRWDRRCFLGSSQGNTVFSPF